MHAIELFITIPDDEKVSKLMALDTSVSEDTARLILFSKPERGQRVGFQLWELSNNNANTRRMKERLVQIEREMQKRESTPDEYEIGGVRVVENNEANRLQLFFDEKPEPDVRYRLKSRGFHWALSVGAAAIDALGV